MFRVNMLIDEHNNYKHVTFKQSTYIKILLQLNKQKLEAEKSHGKGCLDSIMF